jgi:hypothetical protein
MCAAEPHTSKKRTLLIFRIDTYLALSLNLKQLFSHLAGACRGVPHVLARIHQAAYLLLG